MSSTLNKYIENIQLGKPINLRSFIMQLEKIGIDREQAIAKMNSSRVNGDSYSVVLDQEFESVIRSRMVAPGATRSEASSKNRSHDVKVNGSYLLLRKGTQHPQVVLFDDDGVYSEVQQCQVALVIENRQNFLSIEKTSQFLSAQCGITLDENVDVIFGAGMEISNTLHRNYLTNYTKLMMFLDLDEGGLKIAQSIYKHTPKSMHTFIVPKDIEERLSRSPVIASQQVIESVFKIAKEVPFLVEAAQLIMKRSATLEQESYLQ